MDDTIYALSSGRLPAALAIMRISGPDAARALTALAGTLPQPRTATLRTLKSAADGVLDRALTLWFPRPASATGEDVAELHLHGSIAIADAVCRALADLGLRAAAPGEFTRRAVLNGVVGFNDAEGLADLLAAETEAQRRDALLRSTGAFDRALEAWTVRLLAIAAEVERAIDHDEDDGADVALITSAVFSLQSDIAAVLARPPAERLRDGVRVVIVGPVNAGKSTLFNALIGSDAAIISAVEGTTRDLVERPVAIDGIPFILCDTAGWRETGDVIEQIGIARAQAAAAAADIIIDLFESETGDTRTIRVSAKADLHRRSVGGIAVSAVTGDGLDDLVTELLRRARSLLPRDGEVSLSRRQRAGCALVVDALARARQETDVVLIAEHISSARQQLDLLTGRAGVEDMFDALFARFCLGK